MARLALAFSGGAALALLTGRFSLPALLASLLSLAPIPASRCPRVRAALCAAALAGAICGVVSSRWEAAASPPPVGWSAAWRAHLVQRLDTLYGTRAPVVAALTLAETRELDRRLKDDFARSGTTHILSISGFHVAVVAGLALALIRALGASRRKAALGAALGSWLYVALLGFPDAASRAAVMLSAVALSQARGRPPARWGGLGAALLVLVALDPRRLASAGFQLSFAGAAGLVGWAGPLRRSLRRRAPRHLPDALVDGTAAGVAATLATLPVAIWHFERVPLVGIPATLLATPWVVLALPGALVSLALDAVHPAAGRFLAGGVMLALDAFVGTARAAAAPSWASVWVPRTWVSAGAVGALAAGHLAYRLRRRTGRRTLLAAGAAAAIVAWPALLTLQARGSVEVLMVDVGQGDAVALRSPGGRWILVDAGPPWDGDPGASPVARTLRRRGVHQLEALVLTHPDLDHMGGAPAVLASFPVGEILDPAAPAGKAAYVQLLAEAARRGVPWRRARAGDRRSWDGLEVRVLHPGEGSPTEGGDTDSNDASVVLSATYGSFDVLLTGDAPTAVERSLLPGIGQNLEVLKVGHHGSLTSTAPELLAHAPPALALVSVGRRNRYGHPAPRVLARLSSAGAEIRRTDEDGTLAVLGRRDGTWVVRSWGRRGR